MDETTNTNQGTPSGQSSDGKNGTTSTATPKTYTEAEYQATIKKAVSDKLAEQGRKHAEAIKSYEERLRAIEEEREQQELEGIKDNPDLLDLHKQRKATKEAQAALKAERAKLEEERTAFQEKLTRAEKIERDMSIVQIAEKYENSDPDRLSELADKLSLTDPAKIEALASTLWTKAAEKPASAPRVDSGQTSGGGPPNYAKVDFGANAPSASDMIKAGLKKK